MPLHAQVKVTTLAEVKGKVNKVVSWLELSEEENVKIHIHVNYLYMHYSRYSTVPIK